MARLMGTTDEITTCDCCGKSGLKLTVAIDIDGVIVHYGRDCAAKTFRYVHCYRYAQKANAERIIGMANKRDWYGEPYVVANAVPRSRCGTGSKRASGWTAASAPSATWRGCWGVGWMISY